MNVKQPRRRARWVTALAAGLVAASLLAVPGASGQSVVDEGPASPRQWPQSFLAAPELEAWPNAVRMWGPDRHQTALAVSLTLRGVGGYPFDTPDATSGDGRSLGSADGWWGLGLCPRSIIVVASDVPADALTAAALSDSTGRSSEPYLRRVAASDPLFDPIGGFARVDTFAAPILLTDSTRAGADSLNHAARLAAQDLRTGGCNAARQAIVVGGPAAVPVEIELELVSIGYGEVFRVSGDTPLRYGCSRGPIAGDTFGAPQRHKLQRLLDGRRRRSPGLLCQLGGGVAGTGKQVRAAGPHGGAGGRSRCAGRWLVDELLAGAGAAA